MKKIIFLLIFVAGFSFSLFSQKLTPTHEILLGGKWHSGIGNGDWGDIVFPEKGKVSLKTGFRGSTMDDFSGTYRIEGDLIHFTMQKEANGKTNVSQGDVVPFIFSLRSADDLLKYTHNLFNEGESLSIGEYPFWDLNSNVIGMRDKIGGIEVLRDYRRIRTISPGKVYEKPIDNISVPSADDAIKPGTYLTILARSIETSVNFGIEGNWLYIDRNGSDSNFRGWVFEDIITKTDKYGNFGKTNDSEIRIRTFPTLDAATVGHLNGDEYIHLLDETVSPMKIGNMNTSWYKIKRGDGTVGWSYGFFIDPIDFDNTYDLTVKFDENVDGVIQFNISEFTTYAPKNIITVKNAFSPQYIKISGDSLISYKINSDQKTLNLIFKSESKKFGFQIMISGVGFEPFRVMAKELLPREQLLMSNFIKEYGDG
jgi:hypothetical protein